MTCKYIFWIFLCKYWQAHCYTNFLQNKFYLFLWSEQTSFTEIRVATHSGNSGNFQIEGNLWETQGIWIKGIGGGQGPFFFYYLI